MDSKTMSTMYFLQHDIFNVLTEARTKRPDKIVILGYTEWEIPQIDKEFIDTINELNIDLTIMHGCFKSQHHIDHYQNIGFPIEKVEFWGTHFFNMTNMHLSTICNPRFYKANTEFKHNYICLNNRSHIHRCMLVEELAKQNLIDSGIVTWTKHLNENSDYPFEYFDGQQRLLNDNFITELNSYTIPNEYHDSFFDVLTEANPNVHIFSEKTVKPLLLKKPFIILGAKGIHKTLQSLGFKLYDEFIDYSFDDVDDLQLRTKLYVENVKRIVECDSKQVYEQLLPKILFNHHTAVRLLTDVNQIPKHVLDYHVSVGSPTDTEIGVYLYLAETYGKVCELSIWNNNPTVVEELKTNPNSFELIVVNNAVEGEYNMLNNDVEGVDKLIDICNDNNVPYVLITSAANYSKSKLRNTDVNRIDSPGFWINRTVRESLIFRDINSSNGLNIFDNNVNINNEVKYLYTSFNNLAHHHRCLFMDILAKYELIDIGKISWRDVSRKYDNDRNEIPDSIRFGYPYKYWTPVRINLDMDHLSSTIDQSIIPIELKHSFMHVVCESFPESFFLSEKTGVPLVYNKIFLSVASQHFHKNLVDMGFKLFNNLFDYSFDDIDDMDIRFEGLIENINRYRNYTDSELQELLLENEHIIRHNRQVALDYALNKVPNELRNIVSILEGRNVDNTLSEVMLIEGMKYDIF